MTNFFVSLQKQIKNFSNMKRFTLTILVITLSFCVFAQQSNTIAMTGCNTNIPGWGNSLGSVSFASNQTWTIGNQTWSDAVTATACQKETFNGGCRKTLNFSADCRSNPGFPGDFFSWCAIVRFAVDFCPYPWRVPTREDFITLDRILGGTGIFRNTRSPRSIRNHFINRWGGAFGGFCYSDDLLLNRGSWGLYWTLSEQSADQGFGLFFDTRGNIIPQNSANKGSGLALRCVQ